jgi:alpha-mannosidase
MADPYDTWGRGTDSFQQVIGQPTFLSSGVVEDGPTMRVTRQHFRWQESDIAVDLATFPGSDIVRMHFVIFWKEHQQMLKLQIPTAFPDPQAFAMVPGAVTDRPTTGEEEPYQDWVAVQGQLGGKDYTLALMNNCTYSYACKKNVLQTVLIRSAPYTWASVPGHFTTPIPPGNIHPWQDQGRQERVFWLVGRRGAYTDLHLDRLADEMQSPAEYVIDSRHPGTWSWQRSFFAITPGNVSLLSLKRAEDNSGAVILRVQERAGKNTTMHLECDLLRLKSDVPLRPWEVKTLRLEPSRHPRAVSTLET